MTEDHSIGTWQNADLLVATPHLGISADWGISGVVRSIGSFTPSCSRNLFRQEETWR